MRKFLVLFIVTAMMIGVFSVNAQIDDTIAEPPNEYEERYNITYIQVIKSFHIEGTPLKIGSAQGLADRLPELKIIAEYDDSFFEDKFLIFIFGSGSCSACYIRVTSIQSCENSFDIEITRGMKDIIAGDEVIWSIAVLEIDREYLGRNFTVREGDDGDIITIPPICNGEQVATPTATPTNRTFTNSVNVTLATETDGATIHFTTDGTEPTTASTAFTTPIRLTATTTIRAIAVAEDMEDSEVLIVTFTRQAGHIGNGGVTTHTVTFNTNGGNAIINQSINQNVRATRPADPTREGFAFVGWYADSAFTTAFDFNTQITSNITIFARWTENQTWEENPFVDVRENDWFYNYVEYVFTNDLMQGVSATEFAPNAPTTRAMAVTILWRLAGEPTANTQNGFYDVAAGTWYANAVQWAAENGIVLGIGEDLFAPRVEITREQMAAILWRYSNSPNADNILSFSDTESISYWAVNAVTWAVGNDVLRLRANETIAPQALATRTEIAFAMTRIADR